MFQQPRSANSAGKASSTIDLLSSMNIDFSKPLESADSVVSSNQTIPPAPFSELLPPAPPKEHDQNPFASSANPALSEGNTSSANDFDAFLASLDKQ